MANQQQVIDLHQKHPEFTSKQIAAAILGAGAEDYQRLTSTDGWVRRTAQRKGIQLAKVPTKPRVHREPRPDGLLALGRACRAAGLTLADIKDIDETVNA